MARSPDAPATRGRVSGSSMDEIREDRPTMTVLSLSLSWAVSMDGMVPDIERSRVMVEMVVEVSKKDRRLSKDITLASSTYRAGALASARVCRKPLTCHGRGPHH